MSGLSYKKKFILFCLAIGVLAMVGYQLSIKKTLKVRQEYAQLAAMNQVPVEELSLMLREKLLRKRAVDSLLQSVDSSSGQSDIISAMVKNAEGFQLTVEGITREVESDADAPLQCSVSGAFVNMVRFVRAAELQSGITVESARFHKQVDRSTKEEKLILDLWIRKIKKNEL